VITLLHARGSYSPFPVLVLKLNNVIDVPHDDRRVSPVGEAGKIRDLFAPAFRFRSCAEAAMEVFDDSPTESQYAA
jgi:hypothetical protein